VDILHYFCLEISANKAAKELGLGYKTVYNRYMFFRRKITAYLDKNFNKLSGELELDETYFGGTRKGKRGRGAYNKAIVFGILERDVADTLCLTRVGLKVRHMVKFIQRSFRMSKRKL